MPWVIGHFLMVPVIRCFYAFHRTYRNFLICERFESFLVPFHTFKAMCLGGLYSTDNTKLVLSIGPKLSSSR